MRITVTIILVLLSSVVFSSSGNEKTHSGQQEEFNLVEFAFHHISDSYRWDFFYKKGHVPVGIELPRILWDKQRNKLYFYGSTTKALKAGWIEEHELNPEAAHGKLLVPGSKEKYLKLLKAIEEENTDSRKKALKKELAQLKPLDFSITKNVLFMFITSAILLLIFIPVARKYKENPTQPPRGLQSLMEMIIVFIRDEVAKNFIPHHYQRFLPLLLNLFFFIWFLNMMGLVPFSANVTGNIAVTGALALISMLVINFNGKKHYWEHIFWFPGVPIFVKPIMFIVEFVSVFTKPFALMIRLFANITAGHLVVLSFVSLIFIFGKLGQVPAVGWGTSVISVVFTLFIEMIELLIAALQAYIFTTLTALFIGQAIEHHE